jgi:hypothetical protein
MLSIGENYTIARKWLATLEIYSWKNVRFTYFKLLY